MADHIEREEGGHQTLWNEFKTIDSEQNVNKMKTFQIKVFLFMD